MQQTRVRMSGITGTIPLTELVDAAWHINADDAACHNIVLVPDHGILSPVTFDQRKVMQILIHLVRNAALPACDGTGTGLSFLDGPHGIRASQASSCAQSFSKRRR